MAWSRFVENPTLDRFEVTWESLLIESLPGDSYVEKVWEQQTE
jgi:hypothetical protein